MLSICDGASENRKFIDSNVQSHPQHSLVSHMRINPYTNGPLYSMSDPPHLIKKNQRNNIYSSGHRDLHTQLLILNGKEMIWEHFVSVLRRDSKRAVPVTKLSAESVYLNNFSKMRVNLAVHALNPIVAQEMLEHENTATSSTQTYILKCSRLFQIFNSEDPFKVIEDPRIKELEDINNWFKIWKKYSKNTVPLFK
jgi:hypothetical protein